MRGENPQQSIKTINKKASKPIWQLALLNLYQHWEFFIYSIPRFPVFPSVLFLFICPPFFCLQCFPHYVTWLSNTPARAMNLTFLHFIHDSP